MGEGLVRRFPGNRTDSILSLLLAGHGYAGQKMASHNNAGTHLATTLCFGAWLRELRRQKRFTQRGVAAAADMDSSHYGKVERGKRLLTDDQSFAIATLFGLEKAEMRNHLIAARLLAECDGNHALAHSVAGLVQEEVAPYLVNNPVNSRPKKK